MKTSEVDANDWLHKFMNRNIGKSVQTLVAEQSVLDVLCALCVRVHKGLKYKILGSGTMEKRHDGNIFISPYPHWPQCG